MNNKIYAVVTFDKAYYQDYLKLLINIPFKSNGSIVSMTGSKPWHDFIITTHEMIDFYIYFNSDVNINADISFREYN
jgi:hypothetical protein